MALTEQVAGEVHRHLAAGFSGLAHGEGNGASQPHAVAAPEEAMSSNASTGASV